jgi:amidase
MNVWLFSQLVLSVFRYLTAPRYIDYLTLTVAELLVLLNTSTVTSEDIAIAYLTRIHQNNHDGLLLRAVLETAPYENVLRHARLCDHERQNGSSRGPLHGVPILVKDNIATDPSLGMNTTAGSFALRIPLVAVGNC